MSRVIDPEKIEKGTLDADEEQYLADRSLLPEDYERKETKEQSYEDQLNGLSAEELRERAQGAELDLDSDEFKTKAGKLSKPKIVARLVELHESAQGTINPDDNNDSED